MHTDVVSWSSIARSFYTVRGRDEGLPRGDEHSPAAPRFYGVGGLLEKPPVVLTVTSMQQAAIAATAG